MQFAFTGKTSVSLLAAFGPATWVANAREDATNGAVICCKAGCMEDAYGATFEVEMLLNLL
jgi:hypothetical protein